MASFFNVQIQLSIWYLGDEEVAVGGEGYYNCIYGEF